MTTEQRHDEIQRLESRLAFVRRGFLRIADELHDANNLLLSSELSRVLDQLNVQRRQLSAEYRLLVGRLQELKAA